ncbi:putative uncharacterized protein [Mycolicibacterium fortuitum subsp. acetamidolyticum]|uniref:Uncharacterized protein n=1 Tax=Mycolicibacterium fortuitum subsp. acetamidolyticum TaxID=144550 RepID=A0A124E4F4_MYCFO|nr:HGGxSTG domain-containing protein [Mycolicibacterium fortuitum]MCV7140371.1 hypothetical protein [Mycolicibacterium fortuitum]GAT02949.1 putative uncharacterized protein [Mycolicibacterium fortuitum subsp. acetamidolyticum]
MSNKAYKANARNRVSSKSGSKATRASTYGAANLSGTGKPQVGKPTKVAPVKCSARSSRTGLPCQKWPVAGATVCRTHGGSAPQVQKAARRRLEQAADVLVQRLLGIALDGSAPDQVALSAVLAALDRAGLSVKSTVGLEVSAKPWEQVMDSAFALETTSRDAYRAAQDGHPPALAESSALDGALDGPADNDDGDGDGDGDDGMIDAEILTEHEYAASVIGRRVKRIDHTETPDDGERAPTARTAGESGPSGGPVAIDPLTGRPHFDPADFDGPMTMEQANDVVAEMNRRNAERMQRERADTGRAVVHPVRRALPRGRS